MLRFPVVMLLAGIFFLSSALSAETISAAEISRQKVLEVYQKNANRFDLSCMVSRGDQKQTDFLSGQVNAQDPTTFMQGKTSKVFFELITPDESSDLNDWLTPTPRNFARIAVYDNYGSILIPFERVSSDHLGVFQLGNYQQTHLSCNLTQSQTSPVPLEEGDFGVAHIHVHPHTHYDPTGLLKDKIEPILNDDRLRNYVFLEGQWLPFEVSRQLPGKLPDRHNIAWNPANGFSLKETGNATIHIATSGKFKFQKAESSFPNTVLLTGGFAYECVNNTIRNILFSFLGTKKKTINLVLPRRLIIEERDTFLEGSSFEILHRFRQMLGNDSVFRRAQELEIRDEFRIDLYTKSIERNFVDYALEVKDSIPESQVEFPVIRIILLQ